MHPQIIPYRPLLEIRIILNEAARDEAVPMLSKLLLLLNLLLCQTGDNRYGTFLFHEHLDRVIIGKVDLVHVKLLTT